MRCTTPVPTGNIWPPVPVQMPRPLKHAVAAAGASERVQVRLLRGTPETCVPGAMRSGFFRWSAVGPRLENGAMSSALFACESVVPHPSAPPKS